MENKPMMENSAPSNSPSKGIINKLKNVLGATALVAGALGPQGAKASSGEEMLVPLKDGVQLSLVRDGFSKEPKIQIAGEESDPGHRAYYVYGNLNQKFAQQLTDNGFSGIKIFLTENWQNKDTLKFTLNFFDTDSSIKNPKKTVEIEVKKSAVVNKYAMEEFFAGIVANELK